MGWEARAGGAGGGAPGPTLRVGLQGKLRGPAGRAARGLPRRRRPQGSRLRPWPPLALEPEPHCARSGPARPDPRPRRLPGLRGVGSPDPRNFRLGVAGKRRGQQGPGAGEERACPQPTGEGSHRLPARPPAASEGRCPGRPAKLAQNKSKSSGRRRGGGAAAREDPPPSGQGAPGAAGVRGLRDSAAPPWKRRTRGAPRSAPQPPPPPESRLQRVRGCSRGHTCGAPASPRRRSAVRRPDIN